VRYRQATLLTATSELGFDTYAGTMRETCLEVKILWAGRMDKLASFQMDIRPLFTERDIRAMSKAFDLTSYDDVKAHAAVIYDRIRELAVPSCLPRRREEKALGLNPKLSFLPSGSRMDIGLRKESSYGYAESPGSGQ
jgi:hypothetical protein